MLPKIVPVTEFRSQVLKAVRKAQSQGQEYVITTNGEPSAVLMSFDEWESLVETLEIKQDKKLMDQIKKSKRYFETDL
ncbi:MAG: type II toxin-antitoxin system Phd/YefM family antitoxin [Deltaproteobacteria bacterium]|nr:type II toxin-antitoxin system Phd/YefM family antitoxin [Deltaproteobacteria bacterium]